MSKPRRFVRPGVSSLLCAKHNLKKPRSSLCRDIYLFCQPKNSQNSSVSNSFSRNCFSSCSKQREQKNQFVQKIRFFSLSCFTLSFLEESKKQKDENASFDSNSSLEQPPCLLSCPLLKDENLFLVGEDKFLETRAEEGLEEIRVEEGGGGEQLHSIIERRDVGTTFDTN